MAREGRFGRLPRAAPNLSSLIVQMVREINAQEDTNILNAWEEGGEFNGKPVTDQMLLKHFKGRRDAISKTDPEWEKWDQAVDNYTFSIEESKMSLKYAQHKVGEGDMVAFYKNWAGKVPTNSEAYRNLMRSAAQFADAAQARSSATSAAASASAENAAMQSVYDKYEKDWDAASLLMLQAAKRAGILQQTDTATEEDDLMDLRGGDEADHARFMDLFDQVQSDPYFADIKAAMDKYGVSDLSYGEFVSMGDNKGHGIDMRIKVARQFGDDSTAKDLLEESTHFTLLRAKVGDLNEFATYQNYRRQMEATLSQDVLNPYEARNLLTEYRGMLDRFRNSSEAEEDRGFFNNEYQAMLGEDIIAPTAYEMNEGGIRSRTSADSLTFAQQLALSENVIDEVESGRALLSLSIDETGQEAYGAIRRTDPALTDPTRGTTIITAQTGNAQTTMPLYVVYRPIMVAGLEKDPVTGNLRPGSAEMGTDAQVGVTWRLDGKDYYGIFKPNSGGREMTYFSESPFKTNSQQAMGENGELVIQIDPSELVDAPGYEAEVAGGLLAQGAIQDRALNPELQFTYRHDSEWDAIFDRNAPARDALLRTSDQGLQALAAASVSGRTPDEAYAELTYLRNNIVQIHNARAESLMDEGALDRGVVLHAARQSVLEGKGGALSPELQFQLQTFDQTRTEHDRAVMLTSLTREGERRAAIARGEAPTVAAPVSMQGYVNMLSAPSGRAPYMAGLQGYGGTDLRPGTPTAAGQPSIKVPSVAGLGDLTLNMGGTPQPIPRNVLPPALPPVPRATITPQQPKIAPHLLESARGDQIRTPKVNRVAIREFATPSRAKAMSPDFRHWLETEAW